MTLRKHPARYPQGYYSLLLKIFTSGKDRSIYLENAKEAKRRRRQFYDLRNSLRQHPTHMPEFREQIEQLSFLVQGNKLIIKINRDAVR